MVIWVKFTHSSPFSLLNSKMSVFALAISSLTTSNLPWFMDLTFQVPMQYFSLQHQTLFLSLVTSTTGYCFCFGSITSFFLELFLHWSVAYWAPNDLGSSSFGILSFCLFILFMGSQGKNTEVVCYSLLQWTTFCQTSPSWPTRLGWPHREGLVSLPPCAGSWKKQESSSKTSISALLTMPKPLTVYITINWKILKDMEYQTTWPASWEICMQVRKQQLELDME